MPRTPANTGGAGTGRPRRAKRKPTTTPTASDSSSRMGIDDPVTTGRRSFDQRVFALQRHVQDAFQKLLLALTGLGEPNGDVVNRTVVFGEDQTTARILDGGHVAVVVAGPG